MLLSMHMQANIPQDLLTSMNSYPFLDNKRKPIFTAELAEIVPRVRRERVIDITSSPLVSATKLRSKLELLHKAGELDGGLPILRDGVLVGLIPAPDLEFALDQLENESESKCLMDRVPSIDEDDDDWHDPTDFTQYIDPVGFLLSMAWARARLRQVLTLITGPSCFGHSFATRPCIRVFRQAWASVHLCCQEWQIRRNGRFIQASREPVY